jgi:hypothetical protein
LINQRHILNLDDGRNDESIELDVENTVRALVSNGECDPFLRDQFSSTVYDIFSGSAGTLRWLRHQEEVQWANLPVEEYQTLLYMRAGYGLQHEKDQSLLLDILPKGDLLRSVARNPIVYPESAKYSKGEGNIFTRVVVATILSGNLDVARTLIAEFIAAGADLYAIESSMGHQPYSLTPLIFLIYCILHDYSSEPAQFRSYARIWLKSIADAGVYLEEYGATERAMHARGEVSWTFGVDLEFHNKVWGNYCNFQILDIYPAANPEDWRIEFEELYVSAGLLEDFWTLVEDMYEEEDGDDEKDTMTMPGSWCN